MMERGIERLKKQLYSGIDTGMRTKPGRAGKKVFEEWAKAGSGYHL